ncbi:carbonic anhydrase 1 [Rhipicephalus sanguineus]|uniref:carbonic anhydrase 1 n=1 Tax=Rhipicephalus sanguineus TaxID=34632 RepID=UPI0020C5AC10|nr:carbonic anhydrase 1 [Rhipicephalus sanguineus]
MARSDLSAVSLLPSGRKAVVAWSSLWVIVLNAGIAEWAKLRMDTKNQCDGSYQSPIDISTSATIFDSSLGPINYMHYSEALRDVIVENDGHTGSKAALTLDGLPGVYKFKQLHFHWGDKSSAGSEHRVDGKSFALEMHLVHINTAYASTEEAYNHRDGLLVVAVLFKVEARENRALGNVVKTLRQMNERVERRGRLSQLASLADLLPQKPSFSYFYRGSLTTPPCAEAVIWAVLKNYEKISESQLEVFRHLQAERTPNGTLRLVNNFRPSMPLNGRHVYRNFP